MDISFELITGVALGVENFIDEVYGDSWVISIFIFRIIITPSYPAMG